MTDVPLGPRRFPAPRDWSWAWITIAAIPVLVALFDTAQLGPTLRFAAGALWNTLPFILFAIFAIGYLKATGAETLLAKAFEGRETRMIVLAAVFGGLSPFCSCEVIPFIAALLAVGAPLSAVMAFWLSSPLMDPAMFAITGGALGFDFAIAKTVSAVGIGLLGGFGVRMLADSAVFANPLREKPAVGGCCGVKKPYAGTPVWTFWTEADRRDTFSSAVKENALFLGKWLLLAYLLEALMLEYVPADWIAGTLGGSGIVPVVTGALVGMPAYLNGYAAVGMVEGMLAQGMAPGAAMSFVLAGGVSCIPAAVAVWALVKPRVFAAYIGIALFGSIVAGVAWGLVA